jgi:hypothetical protein
MIGQVWYATPWMIRSFCIGTLATLVLIIILRITKEIVQAKQTLDQPQQAAETDSTVSVEYIYSYVDRLIRAGLKSVANSENAMQQGREAEAHAFALAALAYLQSALHLAPKRTEQVVPNIHSIIEKINGIPPESLKHHMSPLPPLSKE